MKFGIAESGSALRMVLIVLFFHAYETMTYLDVEELMNLFCENIPDGSQ